MPIRIASANFNIPKSTLRDIATKLRKRKDNIEDSGNDNVHSKKHPQLPSSRNMAN